MRITTKTRLLGAGLAFALAACAPIEDEPLRDGEEFAPEIGTVEQGIVGGILTSARPEVGRFFAPGGGGCTATLIAPQYIVTAAHCVGYGNPTGGSFWLGNNSYNVARTYSFDGDPAGAGNNGVGARDIALSRLATPVPAAVATPATIGWQKPHAGEQVTAFGFGCTDRDDETGGGSKRAITFAYGDSTALCPGDSGGPLFLGSRWGSGALVGINSGFWNGSGSDIFGIVETYKERIEQTIRDEQGLEAGMNRPGHDFRAANLAQDGTAGARACRELCDEDERCRAFTFNDSNNRCWLKDAVPHPVPGAGLFSGLARTRESGADRAGHDYASTYEATAERCEARCAADTRCAAYTYVSTSDRCWLKNHAGVGRACNSCTSGARRSNEEGFDRPGGDFRSLSNVSDPNTCAVHCARDSRCKAWTFSAVSNHCWLKDEVTPVVRNNNAYSGVRRGFEYNVDRPGQDFRSFGVGSPDPHVCQSACENDGRCKAWTMTTEPSGAGNRCWLKSGVPGGVSRFGMVSGRRGMGTF